MKKTISITLLLVCLLTIITPAVKTDAVIYAVGTEESLKCPTGWSLTKQPCVLAAVSNYAEVYVMRDSATDGDYMPSGATPNANAQRIANEFDSIYNMLSSRNSPYYTGLPLYAPGMEKTVIILLDIDLDGQGSGSQSGYSIGRFTAASSIQNKDDAVIYMDIAATQGGDMLKNDPTGYFSILAREYQHYITQSSFIRATGNKMKKDTWLEEAVAELAVMNYSRRFPSLSELGGHQFRSNGSMIPTDTQWREAAAAADKTHLNAYRAVAGLLALTLQEKGADMAALVSDNTNYGVESSHKMMGKAYSGEATIDGFDKLFTDFALKFCVDDQAGRNPRFSSFGSNTSGSIDVGARPLTEGQKAYFSASRSPYMPQYNIWFCVGRIPADKNAVTIQHTENKSPGDTYVSTRFFVIYSPGGNNNREYMELNRNGSTTVPVGWGNSFMLISVTYEDFYTDASIVYSATIDDGRSDALINPPRNLSATAAGYDVTLNWTAPLTTGGMLPAATYEVYRDGVRVGTTTATTFRDNGLKLGMEYSYYVVAINGNAVSARSNEVKVIVGAEINPPTGVTATLTDNNTRVRLSWSAPSTQGGRYPAESYLVYKNGALLTESTGLSLYDSAIQTGRSYVYYVIAKNESILSSASATVTATVPRGQMYFSDVDPNSWYYKDLRIAYENGLIGGVTATTFAPDYNLTYAEAVTLAACMHQLYTIGMITLINGDLWYQPYVDYAKANGIIAGDYSWNTQVTRAGYMEIFAKALPDSALPAINVVPNGSIPDVPMTHPNAAAIYKLYRAGVISGVDEAKNSNPSSDIKRYEVAVVLTRMMYSAERLRFVMP